MKEICFDARMLLHGGIGTYIRNLLPGLKPFFHLRVIVSPKIIESEKWLQDYDLILSTASIYSIQEQMEFFFRVPKVDLFFSPHYNVPLVPIKAAKRAVTIHDVFHLAHSSSLRLHERLYAKYVIHQAVFKSDLIFTDSQFSLSEIRKYTKGSKEKIHPVYCGVDRRIFRREANGNKIEKVIQKFGLPSRYFLFVGNLKPHKNIKGLLLAMRNLTDEIKLVIIGKSEAMLHVDSGDSVYQQYPELRERVLSFSHVGDEELPVFYQLAEALVFPSYYEGFGLPPLEAMSCGCAVIASNVASLPEVCGSAAMYVSPENSNEIALAMIKVMDDKKLKRELIEKGYQNVEKFDWNRSIEKHLQCLEKKIFSL